MIGRSAPDIGALAQALWRATRTLAHPLYPPSPPLLHARPLRVLFFDAIEGNRRVGWRPSEDLHSIPAKAQALALATVLCERTDGVAAVSTPFSAPSLFVLYSSPTSSLAVSS